MTVKWERCKDWSQTEEAVVQTGTWLTWLARNGYCIARVAGLAASLADLAG